MVMNREQRRSTFRQVLHLPISHAIETQFITTTCGELAVALTELKQVVDVDFPTRWARFRLFAFEAMYADGNPRRKSPATALALVLGDLHRDPPIVRIHSQCTTGDVFHSLRCDCHDQLHLALRLIAEKGTGILLYEQQEGRGIGLVEKLRAYELQDKGFDTVDANLILGHPVDLRDYELPMHILQFLGIRSIRLMTNNPEKINAVRASGIEIIERLSADVPINPHSARYLATKRTKLGHFSDLALTMVTSGERTAG
jgi:GTP cyclohydrolase II